MYTELLLCSLERRWNELKLDNQIDTFETYNVQSKQVFF